MLQPPKVEYKSKVYIGSIILLALLELLAKIYLLTLSFNIFHLPGIIFCLVIPILVGTHHRYVISWIRGWALIEIISGSLFLITSVLIYFLSSDESTQSTLLKVLQGGASIGLGSYLYFVTPKQILLKATNEIDNEQPLPDSVLAQKLKINN